MTLQKDHERELVSKEDKRPIIPRAKEKQNKKANKQNSTLIDSLLQQNVILRSCRLLFPYSLSIYGGFIYTDVVEP